MRRGPKRMVDSSRRRNRLPWLCHFRSSTDDHPEPSMFEYVCLAILLCGLTLTFYAFIYIHDIPYEIAKHRNHPQTEAIHAACWLSLFTLHAIWPIVFIWAISK